MRASGVELAQSIKRLEALVELLKGRSSAIVAGARVSFVFRPGVVAGNGVYTTWSTLMAAMLLVDQAAQKFVSVDDSLAAAHATTGTWTFDNVTFESGVAVGGATLIIDDGCHWAFRLAFARDIIISAQGTTAAWVGPNAGTLFLQGAVLTSTGAGGFLRSTFGSQFIVADQQSVIGDGTHPVITVDPAGTANVSCYNGSVLEANASQQGSGPGGQLVVEFDGASQSLISTTQVPAPIVSNLDPQPTFVFKPGATQLDGANVFATWAALMASVALTPGPKTILIDDTLAAAHMTAGTWNLDNVTLLGQNSSPTETLIIDAGAVIQSSYIVVDGGLIISNAAASPWSPTTFFTFDLRDGAIESTAAASPFLNVNAAAANGSVIFVDGMSAMGDGTATHNVVTVGATHSIIMELGGNGQGATVRAHALAGAGAYQVWAPANSQFAAQADVTGTLTLTFADSAAQVAFTPATNGNWNPVPTTTKGGLDQLAASNSEVGTGNTGTGTATVTATAAAITKAKNGQMRVSASCALSSSAACTLTVQLKKDGANIGTPKSVVAAAAINAMDAGISFIDTAADNAAHTYSCTWTASAGTLTVAAGSAQIQVLEDS